jgi:acetoin utilization deacetylase AcuC-like enzyme
VLFISAGFDAHFQDDLGNLQWLPEDYAWLTQQLVAMANRHCAGRIISVLEGGYNLESLARCAAVHVQGLLEHL